MRDESKRPDLRIIPAPPVPQAQRDFQALAISLGLLIGETEKPEPRPPGNSVLSGMTW